MPIQGGLAGRLRFTSQAIGKWAKTRLTPGCVVLSDGLG
jgi:hypothetical protein